MSRNRRTIAQVPPPSRSSRPLDRLERIQPVYFFTPDLEREINKLDGVTSCRVLSTGIEIEEIHVIAPPERAPKKIVRNIESLLLVHFGIRIDHRKISIVQLGPTGQAATLPTTVARPRITKIEKHATAQGVEVCVEINSNGRAIRGTSRGKAGESDAELSSHALIKALEQLLNRQEVLSLQEIAGVRVGQQDIVVSLVRSILEEQEELLVGATVARGEPLEDAARATFDAVNRKLVRAHPLYRDK